MAEEESLYRFGLEWEPTRKLDADCRAAEQKGYPHGVSTFDETNRTDACRAVRAEVERHFSVIHTGRNPAHHTVVLPKPVSDDVANLFNHLFGRTR